MVRTLSSRLRVVVKEISAISIYVLMYCCIAAERCFLNSFYFLEVLVNAQYIRTVKAPTSPNNIVAITRLRVELF